MNYYEIGLATGLTVEQAKLFATAMTYEGTDINHLIITK